MDRIFTRFPVRYRGYDISKSCGWYYVSQHGEIIEYSLLSPEAAITIIDGWVDAR